MFKLQKGWKYYLADSSRYIRVAVNKASKKFCCCILLHTYCKWLKARYIWYFFEMFNDIHYFEHLMKLNIDMKPNMTFQMYAETILKCFSLTLPFSNALTLYVMFIYQIVWKQLQEKREEEESEKGFQPKTNVLVTGCSSLKMLWTKKN